MLNYTVGLKNRKKVQIYFEEKKNLQSFLGQIDSVILRISFSSKKTHQILAFDVGKCSGFPKSTYFSKF